jgi:ferric-dicitrate binding protein FerR (iron transport regulator)
MKPMLPDDSADAVQPEGADPEAMLDPFLFEDALAPEQRAALHGLLQADAALHQRYLRCKHFRAALHQRLQACDHHLLVLHALQTRGQAHLLTEQEQTTLAAEQAALEQTLCQHPALADVLHRIGQEADDFDACWRQGTARPWSTADRAVRPAARRWAGRMGVGLAVAGVLALAWFGWWKTDPHIIRTAVGEIRIVELTDGSTVRLLGDSQLAVQASGAAQRQVHLDGRAFFDIVPAPQPFVVETPTARATAVGTRFSVQAHQQMTEAVLVEGRLTLASRQHPDQTVTLVPGQQGRMAATGTPSSPATVDLAAALDWTGLFIFQAHPLSDILTRLQTHYGVALACTPTLAPQAVTGTFERGQPLEEILTALAAALSAHLVEIEGGYRLEPAS